MTSYLKNAKHAAEEDVLYPWGVAELTDKWVLLHRNGLPKWAIFYKGKGRTVVVPCSMLSSRKRVMRIRRTVKKGPDN